MNETMNTDINSSTAQPAAAAMGTEQPKEAAKRKRNSANKYKTYEEARQFAVSLNLKSRKEWREYVKGLRPEVAIKPEDIPAHPDGIYKTKGWQGWRQWLGTEKPSTLN